MTETADLVRFLLGNESWMADAACRGMGPDLFFPKRGQSHLPGLAVCARCPVGDQCEQYADRTENEYGMWNGKIRSRVTRIREEPEETAVIPRTLSASSIQKYLGCPAGWKAEYMEGARMPGGAAASIGTVCHSVMEVWVRDDHYRKTAIQPFANQVAIMKGIYDEAYWGEFSDGGRFDDGWALMKKWLARQNWDDREVISTESKESFDIPTTAGPIKFNFIMDRLDRLRDGTYEIIDYKTVSQPVQPQELKNKPQCRIYALAVQLKYPEAGKIWMTFDLLRYDQTIGIVFTKEENRATWNWLCQIAQRIVDDDTAEENLNDDCRWCVRKSKCTKLQAHAAAGGPLALSSPALAAQQHYAITRQVSALNVQAAELEDYLLEYMRKENILEEPFEQHTVRVTVSQRRGVDDDRLRDVIGDVLMAKYGKMTMAKLDEMLKGDDLVPDQKARVRELITKNFGDPAIKVDRIVA